MLCLHYLADRLKKFFSTHTSVLVIAAALSLWVILFYPLLLVGQPFIIDAPPYFGTLTALIQNYQNGIYPLWDPGYGVGAPNEFFLRRIGEFNPFYIVYLVMFSLAGSPVPQLSSYTEGSQIYVVFTILYYFFGAIGFYRLAQTVLRHTPSALLAFLLLLFSSLGFIQFLCFSHLLFVPIVWFFAFFISWCRHWKAKDLLGWTLCVAIIVTTYLPFYFMVIVIAALISWVMIFPDKIFPFFHGVREAYLKNKILFFACAVMILTSLAPGYIFMQMSKQDVQLPIRSADANRFGSGNGELESSAQVGMQSFQGQGVVLPSILEHLFHRLTDRALFSSSVDYTWAYFSFFGFLILFLGAAARADRKLIFLMTWLFLVFLVSQNIGTPVYPFLFKHVFFFRYFRNAYFYLWIFLLPMTILIIAQLFRTLIDAIERRNAVHYWSMVNILAHGIFLALLVLIRHGVLATYVTVCASFVFWILVIIGKLRMTTPQAIWLLCVIAVLHPVQVIPHHVSNHIWNLSETKDFFSQEIAEQRKRVRGIGSYYATRWGIVLKSLIASDQIAEYLTYQFVLYDRLLPFDEASGSAIDIQRVFVNGDNIALVPADYAGPLSVRDDYPAFAQRISYGENDRMEIVQFDHNTLIVRTHFATEKFCVYNDAYDAHWTAWINGQKTEIVRANVAFKGIWIPAGEQLVRFRYGALSRYVLGYVLLAMTYGVCVTVIWLAVREKFLKRQ